MIELHTHIREQRNLWSSVSISATYILILRPEVGEWARDGDRLAKGLSNATPWMCSYRGRFHASLDPCREAWLTEKGFVPPTSGDILRTDSESTTMRLRLIINPVLAVGITRTTKRPDRHKDDRLALSLETYIVWQNESEYDTLYTFTRLVSCVHLEVGMFCQESLPIDRVWCDLTRYHVCVNLKSRTLKG